MSFSNFFDKEDYFETNGTGPAASWNCITDPNGLSCVDPGDGSGQYTSYSQCVSACVPSSINENSKNISIYPNPANDILTIDGRYIALKIYDLFGKLIFSTTDQNTINISSLSNGLYFIDINTEKGNIVKKITVSN